MTGPIDILVVDDFDALAEIVAQYFEIRGWKTRTARNLAEARRMLAERTPENVILDLHLGGEDGRELIPYILALSARCLICTADPKILNDPSIKGVDGVFIKTNFGINELRKALKPPKYGTRTTCGDGSGSGIIPAWNEKE
jgi:CheY-like chemotaxis protein